MLLFWNCQSLHLLSVFFRVSFLLLYFPIGQEFIDSSHAHSSNIGISSIIHFVHLFLPLLLESCIFTDFYDIFLIYYHHAHAQTMPTHCYYLHNNIEFRYPNFNAILLVCVLPWRWLLYLTSSICLFLSLAHGELAYCFSFLSQQEDYCQNRIDVDSMNIKL